MIFIVQLEFAFSISDLYKRILHIKQSAVQNEYENTDALSYEIENFLKKRIIKKNSIRCMSRYGLIMRIASLCQGLSS